MAAQHRGSRWHKRWKAAHAVGGRHPRPLPAVRRPLPSRQSPLVRPSTSTLPREHLGESTTSPASRTPPSDTRPIELSAGRASGLALSPMRGAPSSSPRHRRHPPDPIGSTARYALVVPHRRRESRRGRHQVRQRPAPRPLAATLQPRIDEVRLARPLPSLASRCHWRRCSTASRLVHLARHMSRREL